MKKRLLWLSGLLAVSSVAFAAPHGTFSGQLWSNPVSASTSTTQYVRDLNLSGEIVSAQINYSSATVSAARVPIDATHFILVGSSQIFTTNSFGTGLPVLYSSTVTVTGLTTGTTYYASAPINVAGFSPYFYVSTTYANSVAGTYIQVTSTGTVNGCTATFTPLPINGSAYFVWQTSDDNANWTDLSVSSVTFSSPYTAASTQWDLGVLYGRFLRLVAKSPAAGAINFSVWMNQATSYN